ncbi:hypothetical protein AHMF7616_04051 [Adhaeribacter pallidiroseus]|uniref:Uncharacterized protein n=2 Tax=Adhaeribacter pallidiroseus TaxID=2072847 RepID=A0A369QKJ3_9BACT|nr:hypothetical protein AHMF7616_04051 [Adhaeribacter pallidiroseus]
MRNWYLLILLVLTTRCNNSPGNLSGENNVTSTKRDTASVKIVKKLKRSKPYALETASKADFEQAATRQSISFEMGPDEARKIDGVLVFKIDFFQKYLDSVVISNGSKEVKA